MHLKRQQSPKNWPVKRKGTKYLVRASHAPGRGVPVLIVVRDLLGLADNRREVRKAMNAGKILLNNKKVSDERNTMGLFDVLSIAADKSYRLTIGKNKKFAVEEISEKEAGSKIAKVINKMTLKGKKIQINLSDGRNFISDVKCGVGDSVLINLKDKKIEKILPMKKGSRAAVYAGKHAGEEGVIDEIDEKNHRVRLKEGNKAINILTKQLMVLE